MQTVLKTVLGVAGLSLFIGYCYYFDVKRRKDPKYKQKVKEKRRARKEAEEIRRSRIKQLPEFRDQEDMKKFFLQEFEIGRDLVNQGNEDDGVLHLSNAFSLCGHPNKLLSTLQETVLPHKFQSLLMQLSALDHRLVAHSPSSASF